MSKRITKAKLEEHLARLVELCDNEEVGMSSCEAEDWLNDTCDMLKISQKVSSMRLEVELGEFELPHDAQIGDCDTYVVQVGLPGGKIMEGTVTDIRDWTN